jgi:general secretion pathway protein H
MYRRSAGFTLLELLVVIFIVGIIATMMTLGTGIVSDDRELRRDADRLGALLAYVQDEAVLQGREFGMRFYLQRYEFVELNTGDGIWQVVSDDDLLRPRTLSGDAEFDIEVDGTRIELSLEPEETEAGESEDPVVFLLSSGDVTPFTAFIRPRFESTGISIALDSIGRIEVGNETG